MCGQKNARGGKRQGGVDKAKGEENEVEEEMPRGIRKAPPTKFPPAMRVGHVSVQGKAATQRLQSLLVKHAEELWNRHHLDLMRRVTPPTRMLIRSTDAASLVIFITPLGPPAKGNESMLSGMIPSAPPAQPDYVDLTKMVQEAVFEFLYVNR